VRNIRHPSHRILCGKFSLLLQPPTSLPVFASHLHRTPTHQPTRPTNQQDQPTNQSLMRVVQAADQWLMAVVGCMALQAHVAPLPPTSPSTLWFVAVAVAVTSCWQRIDGALQDNFNRVFFAGSERGFNWMEGAAWSGRVTALNVLRTFYGNPNPNTWTAAGNKAYTVWSNTIPRPPLTWRPLFANLRHFQHEIVQRKEEGQGVASSNPSTLSTCWSLRSIASRFVVVAVVQSPPIMQSFFWLCALARC
jgi:hypothetical protein